MCVCVCVCVLGMCVCVCVGYVFVYVGYVCVYVLGMCMYMLGACVCLCVFAERGNIVCPMKGFSGQRELGRTRGYAISEGLTEVRDCSRLLEWSYLLPVAVVVHV